MKAILSIFSTSGNRLRTIGISTIFTLLCSSPALAQEMGLSFSYFIPRNGYFSTPISPFSIRGIGVDLNKAMALQTGFTLYRMAGLYVRDLPIKTSLPIAGPNFTALVPAEWVLRMGGETVRFDIKGGGFFFYSFAQKIDYGNLDRALRETEGWPLVNASVTGRPLAGFGWHAGAELTLYVSKQFGITLECLYMQGQAGFPLKGSYTGFDGSALQTRPLDFSDAKLDLTGLQFSLGVVFATR